MAKSALVVLNVFPSLSQTFALNQIESLLDRGFAVTVCCFKTARHDQTQAQVARIRKDAANIVTLFPERHAGRGTVKTGASVVGGFTTGLFRLLRATRGRPSAFRELGFGPSIIDERLARFAAARPVHGAYDIILCHFGFTGAITDKARALGFVSGKLAVFFHGHETPGTPGEGKKYRRLMSRAELVVANSAYTARRLAGADLPGNVHVIPTGFFPDRLPHIGPRGEGPDGRFFVIARLVEVKGIAYAIRAIAAVREAGHRATLSVFGEGKLRKELEALAASLALGDAVRFEGGIRQVDFSDRLSQMDAFVLPSITVHGRQEAQGLAAAEAQAMGFPVIVTNTGGLPECVRDNETGYVVPERDPAAIAAKMIQVMSDRARAKAMGDAGRAFAIQKYQQDAITDRILSLLQPAP